MRIGGTARYFAELKTKEDVEQAVAFAQEKNIPLLPLGSGSNTIFCDDEVNALVIQVKHNAATWDGDLVTIGAGKNLAMCVNDFAPLGRDLSALTGIPGTVGGAIFGNAGQGPKGVWIDSFVQSVTAYIDGAWKTFSKDECDFSYRESIFKKGGRALLWEVTLEIPKGDPATIKTTIESLLQKRIETQPHLKTAGSCFKAVGGTPAWQLIDEVKLRGHQVGGVQIAEKHANFLQNTGDATYADACAVVEKAKKEIPEQLEVEMRFIEKDGSLRY